MKRFLSIDWDFFINATADERCILFPDGGSENLPDSIRKYIWDTRYGDPRLEDIEVDFDALQYIRKLCRSFCGKCLITESHKHAFDFIMENTTPDEQFEVYNIDFHHDLYDFGHKRVNCGNWVAKLKEKRPNMKYVWVNREDSEQLSKDEVQVVIMQMSFDAFKSRCGDDFQGLTNHLFLCRSDMWSPPHLDVYFRRLVRILFSNQSADVKYEQGIEKLREFEKPTDFSEYQALASLANSVRGAKSKF